MSISDKFQNLISNDFTGDATFISQRLHLLIADATSLILSDQYIGKTKFKEYKQNAPVSVTDVTDNLDGTIRLTVADSSLFAEDDTVVLYGVSTYNGNTVVTEVGTGYVDVYGTFDSDEPELNDLVLKTQFYDDIETAIVYLCAYQALVNMRKITSEGGGLSGFTYGNGTEQMLSMVETERLMNKYLDRISNIVNIYKEDDAESTGSDFFLI